MKREDKSVMSRQRILEAAFEEFASNEINRVTANAAFRRRRIVAASGMTSAAPAVIFCRTASLTIKSNKNNRHFFHRKG